jgi:hypothetical protein
MRSPCSQPLVTEERVLLNTSLFVRISLKAFLTLYCNAAKSFVGCEYNKLLGAPAAQIQGNKVTGSSRSVYWATTTCAPFTGSDVKVLPDSTKEMRLCCIMHEPHVPRVLVNDSSEDGGTLHLLVR